MEKRMKQKCECCRKRLSFVMGGNQKFCSNCSIYIHKLKWDLAYLRSRYKKLNLAHKRLQKHLNVNSKHTLTHRKSKKNEK